jgi:hypothetical protein
MIQTEAIQEYMTINMAYNMLVYSIYTTFILFQMTNPVIQNDFSYYRRTESRRRMVTSVSCIIVLQSCSLKIQPATIKIIET